MKQVLTPIITNNEVMPEAHMVWLECPQIATIARPGQFVMVGCGEDTYLRRPLSVHQVDDGKIALLFTIAGKGTRWLSQRKTGDMIDIFGPLGNGFHIDSATNNLLLVAGGIGIAPLRFMADVAVKQKKKVTLLMGARTATHLLPIIPAPPKALTDAPFSINPVTATDDGSEGFKGLVTDLMAAYLGPADQIFACGPVGMYRAMAQIPELRKKPVQISLEIMMGCGVGVCYGCTIKTKTGLKQVCKDGPVFDLEDIIWEEVPSW